MQLQFNSIFEPGLPGNKWYTVFEKFWPTYQKWLKSKGHENFPSLESSVDALKRYMPEMVTTYNILCSLVGDNPVAHRFLTGFQPPVYVSGCSQLVMSSTNAKLIRNYDYHPNLMEGTILNTSWNGKKVMVVGDSLIGALDGMNEDGLAVSHTFGGRKSVGVGFGIPFILRYVLEFCSNVKEAVDVLCRIPSHMSYNVTVVDKSGEFKTVQLAPGLAPVISDTVFTTNHQDKIDWPENAAFNGTIERSTFLQSLMTDKGLNENSILNSFLNTPLYNTRFTEGFGTLYTAVYKPSENVMQLHWPNKFIEHTFDNFQESDCLIKYDQSIDNAPHFEFSKHYQMDNITRTNDITAMLNSGDKSFKPITEY